MTNFSFFRQRLLPLPLLLLGYLASHAQGVGIGTTAPNASAALDIVSSSKGVLLPRVAGTSSVSNPATGLVVYQTSSPAGYYYYDGTTWQRLVAGSNTGDFVRNQTIQQAGASFNIGGSGTVGSNLAVAGALTGSGDDIGSTVGVGIRADGGLNLGQNTAGNNVLLGYQAGLTLPANPISNQGAYNQFEGYQSGISTILGSYNLFIGCQSGYYNISGSRNVFSGFQSGLNNTTGNSNTFSGYQSGYSNTIGNFNTFSGYRSGRYNTSGIGNTFSGYASGQNNATGNSNTFSGAGSGQNNQTGSSNTFTGLNSGFYNTTGSNNLFSGNSSGQANVDGGNNTFSGYSSGQYNTSGSNNTALGANSGPASGSGTLTNATALGANVSLTTDNTLVLGNGANVGIGTSSPTAKLEVQGGADSNGGSDPVALAFGYRTGGYRHYLRSRHNGALTTNDNALDFYLNNGSTAAASTAPGAFTAANPTGAGAGTVQVLSLTQNAGSPRVGIGTVNPAQTLDVLGNVRVTNALVGTGADLGTVVGVGVRADGGMNLGQNTTGGNIYLGYLSGQANTTGGGNTFSGTASGQNNTTGGSNTFSGYASGLSNTTGGNNTALGYNSGPANGSGAINNATAIGANVSLTQSSTVILGNNASVGIGTTNPIALLHVSGGPQATPTGGSISYFTPNLGLQQTNGTGARATVAYFTGGQLWASDAIVAGVLQVTSDRRIKHVLGVSNATADLALLNRLRITDYTYIDQHANTNQVVKKVIAQEVEEVLPAAVSRSTQALPDVYERATSVHYAAGYVAVTMAKAHGLPATGGRMRFYTPANQQLDPLVQVVDAHTVRFASAETHAGGLFVYGKYVDDFRSVDYDALTTLNVSATQALARKVEALEQQNATLQAGSAADHASLLTLQAQVARLLGEGAQAQQ